MPQQTHAYSAHRLLHIRVPARTAKRSLLSAIGTAVIMVSALATGSAQASPSPSSSYAVRPTAALWHGYWLTNFRTGPNNWFYGDTGVCTYVGSTWNDNIHSARTESIARVELWEHANCTGTSITIDDSGYGVIGSWVSAYRVTYP
ncbi:hypothetical protein GCM10010372_63000 [Streptomyces tauricus]|uniref:hypothetical protein n=1 Tax=Streptomyces tauricus TaxID=68274 RepID=UPI001672ADD6|nr:hypothetical protein [Streptomyces tauricus]GHA54225.1 hypothetical protein GCM10010372_63000 [Streptomyces tauricus]